MLWSPTTHAAAAALWTKGRPAAEISRELRQQHGVVVSTSGVIGRMWRAGLAQGYDPVLAAARRAANVARLAKAAPRPAPGPSPERRRTAQAKPASRGPAPAPRGVGPPPAAFLGDTMPPPGGVALREARTGQCWFIAGAPTADAVCCGAATYPRTSWCPAHTRLVYQVGTARRR